MTLRDDIRETILAEAMTSGFQMLRRDNFSGIELEDEQNETVPNWRGSIKHMLRQAAERHQTRQRYLWTRSPKRGIQRNRQNPRGRHCTERDHQGRQYCEDLAEGRQTRHQWNQARPGGLRHCHRQPQSAA